MLSFHLHQSKPEIFQNNAGCGSKIGRNIAVAFARMGLKVALVDFNTQQTDPVAVECLEKSPKNRVVSCDFDSDFLICFKIVFSSNFGT